MARCEQEAPTDEEIREVERAQGETFFERPATDTAPGVDARSRAPAIRIPAERRSRMAEKAWRCWVPKIDGDPEHKCALIRAPTRGRARYLALLSAQDAFPDLSFADMRVRRAPQYDRASFRDGVMPRYADQPEEEGEDHV